MLFTMLGARFEDESPVRDQSSESYLRTVLSCGAVYYAVQDGFNF